MPESSLRLLHGSSPPSPVPDAPVSSASVDALLVARCLGGDDQAWSTLIGRYKRLIYSCGRRYGAYDADAADLFQQVCAELFTALPRLRNHESVRSWIISVATHAAYRWKRQRLLRALREGEEAVIAAERSAVAASAPLERTEREEAVRAAIRRLPPRCQEMLRLLFYEDPPMPYHAVAGQLGLSIGSIGLTRARCLKKLSQLLEEDALNTACKGCCGGKSLSRVTRLSRNLGGLTTRSTPGTRGQERRLVQPAHSRPASPAA